MWFCFNVADGSLGDLPSLGSLSGGFASNIGVSIAGLPSGSSGFGGVASGGASFGGISSGGISSGVTSTGGSVIGGDLSGGSIVGPSSGGVVTTPILTYPVFVAFPWLVAIYNNQSGTIIIKQGTFKLLLDGQFVNSNVSCTNVSNGATGNVGNIGRCVLLEQCTGVQNYVTSVTIYESHYCSLGK